MAELKDLLSPGRIRAPLKETTKEGVIRELIDVLAAGDDLRDRDAALQAVLEREKTRTTGIGNGLAIPHGKTDAVGELVMAVGIAPTPVDFESVDGKPVSLVLLLLSPLDKTGPHIQALARISRLMSLAEFRKKLSAAGSAQEVYDAICAEEARHNGA
ncbi:MAG TPA: PTS sucrose transporter subunit IIABC [Phycisphaerales bacterium]|nr:PTS sucrose transporter subunit IIABC [Phycisphaerales bacterium]